MTSSTTVATTEATTTSTTEATTTTLSGAAQRNADIDAARAEIIKVVEDWVTFPVDSDLGDEGMGVELTTGRLRARLIERGRLLRESGGRLHYRGNGEVLIVDFWLDLDAGTSTVEVCMRGDLQEDGADGALVDEDQGSSWRAEFPVVRTERGWRIEEFYYDGPDEEAGLEGISCVLG